jgi:two-component system response regulator AtoC
MDKNQGTILLVDDEVNTLKVLSAILGKEGYRVATAGAAEEALEKLPGLDVDAAVVDYKLPGMNGMEFLEALRRGPHVPPVIMLTAYGTIEKAVEAMKRGAFMYVAKPVNPDQLLAVVREAVAKSRLARETAPSKEALRDPSGCRPFIGRSPAMREVLSLVETVSKSTSNVLLTGESGTGKELVARAIHCQSPRSSGPFVTLDCASLPEETLESAVFGHEKGSFTGAFERKIGQIELAHKGTLFLDEVGELSLNIQKKFLRFLQEREILRIGGNQRIKVDVRIIAATNRDLSREIEEGSFREDLFYRLNVVVLHLPPLRDRREDIPALAQHFLHRFAEANHKVITGLEGPVMDALASYGWPGNVRELENAMERAVVLCSTDTIAMRCLPKSLREPKADPRPSSAALNLFEAEKRLLLNALEKTGWNQTRTAEVLGITRKQLRTRMKNHDLLPGPNREP